MDRFTNTIGDDAIPIGEMRKIQARSLASASRPGHRHYRQRGEDAVAVIQLHRDSGEQARCRAAHRAHEIGCISTGEQLLDVPGFLPVGRQRNLHRFEHNAPAHQPAAHHQRFLSQGLSNCFSVI